MTAYRKLNISELKDSAPEYGMSAMGEARFARQALGAERVGLAYYKMNPQTGPGFGHSHGESEEIYVVLSGSGRFKVGDDIFSVAARDVIYCSPNAVRGWEAGADGMELLASGAHNEGENSEMDKSFWPT